MGELNGRWTLLRCLFPCFQWFCLNLFTSFMKRARVASWRSDAQAAGILLASIRSANSYWVCPCTCRQWAWGSRLTWHWSWRTSWFYNHSAAWQELWFHGTLNKSLEWSGVSVWVPQIRDWDKGLVSGSLGGNLRELEWGSRRVRQGRKEKKPIKAERELVTAVDIWIPVSLEFLWKTTLQLLPNCPVKGREAGTLFVDSLSSLVESCPGGHLWKLRVLYSVPPPPLKKPRPVAEKLTPQALEVEAARVFQELMAIPVCQEFQR